MNTDDKRSPRDHPNHRERGPRRYSYTVEEVARLAGVSVGTARQLRGANLADLGKMVAFITRSRFARNLAPLNWAPERRPRRPRSPQ